MIERGKDFGIAVCFFFLEMFTYVIYTYIYFCFTCVTM